MAEKNVYRYRYQGQEVVIIRKGENVPGFFSLEASSSETDAYLATPLVIDYIKKNNIEQCCLGYEWGDDPDYPESPDNIEDIDLYIFDDYEIFYTVNAYHYTREEIDFAYELLDKLKKQVINYNEKRQSWLPALDYSDLMEGFLYIDLHLHNFIKDDDDYSDEYKIKCVKEIICAICIPDCTWIIEGEDEDIEDYALLFGEDTFFDVINAPEFYNPYPC